MRTRTWAARRVVGTLLTAGVLLGLAAGPAAAQLAPVNPNNRADLILGSGSDTTYFVMRDLDALYNAAPGCRTEATPGAVQPLDFACFEAASGNAAKGNADRDVAVSYYPLGSSNGVAQLCQKGLAGVATVDYARSSRGPRATDCSGIRFVAFAKDAIPWVSFPDAPNSRSAGVTNLTAAQLKGIFVDCTIRDWRQVEGSPVYDAAYTLPGTYNEDAAGNEPILVYAAQRGSGTRATYDGFVGGQSDNCIPQNKLNQRVIFENDATPIVQAGHQANAIFYYSIGRWNLSGGEGTTLGSINGVVPSGDNILSGAYPYSRFVYNAYRVSLPDDNTSWAGQAYVGERHGFICKPNAQHGTEPLTGKNYGELVTETIGAAGFFPLPVGDIGGGVEGQSKCRVTALPEDPANPRPVTSPQYRLTIGDASVSEGNSGTKDATFTVRLSSPRQQAVTVRYATADGTAKAGSDYTAVNGTLTFAPEETVKTVTVPVRGDRLFEDTETYSVVLSQPTNATIEKGTGAGRITNDDTQPAITVTGAKVKEGNKGTKNLNFTIRLSAASGKPVTVKFATVAQTAAAKSDFVMRSGTVTIPAGKTSVTVPVKIVGDKVKEKNETFLLTLNTATGAELRGTLATGTIVNDDK